MSMSENLNPEWMEKVREAYQYLSLSGYDVVFVSLIGSQNYGLNNPNSDYDFKAVVIPKLEYVFSKYTSVLNKDIKYNGGIIKVKDIRLFVSSLKHQNIDSLEMINTVYTEVNIKYLNFVSFLFRQRDNLFHLDPPRVIEMLYGLCYQHIKEIHGLRNKLDDYNCIEIQSKISKRLARLYLWDSYITDYLNGEKYSEFMKPKDHDVLFRIQNNTACVSVSGMTRQADNVLDKLKFNKDANYNKAKAMINEAESNILMKEVENRASLIFADSIGSHK